MLPFPKHLVRPRHRAQHSAPCLVFRCQASLVRGDLESRTPGPGKGQVAGACMALSSGLKPS